MCGRFTLATPAETIAEDFGLADPEDVPELAPRYNIAPTEPVAAIRAVAGGPAADAADEDEGRAAGPPRRVLELRRWGLVPHWAKEVSGPPLFNARAETLARRPAFRDAFRRHRCLIPVDGFFEWRSVSGRRQPFHLRRADGSPFAMAGLHARWRPEAGEPVDSCTVVTTAANGLVATLHDRMPVILPPDAWEAWLDPSFHDVEALGAFLRPADDAGWVAYPVDPRMNRARHDEPSNVEPLFDEDVAGGPRPPGGP